jgi:hypothetical protein
MITKKSILLSIIALGWIINAYPAAGGGGPTAQPIPTATSDYDLLFAPTKTETVTKTSEYEDLFGPEEATAGPLAPVEAPPAVPSKSAKETAVYTQALKNLVTSSQLKEVGLENVKSLINSPKGTTMTPEVVKAFVNSPELEQTVKMMQAVKKMATSEGPGFEILNKTDEPIWFTLLVNDKIKSLQPTQGRDDVAAGGKCLMDIDLDKNITIAIYTSDPGTTKTQAFTYFSGEKVISPTPQYVYTITESGKNKTKYLTWNPAKFNTRARYLYPQTGLFLGLLGVSSSRYLLDKNIKQEDITLKSSED